MVAVRNILGISYILGASLQPIEVLQYSATRQSVVWDSVIGAVTLSEGEGERGLAWYRVRWVNVFVVKKCDLVRGREDDET